MLCHLTQRNIFGDSSEIWTESIVYSDINIHFESRSEFIESGLNYVIIHFKRHLAEENCICTIIYPIFCRSSFNITCKFWFFGSRWVFLEHSTGMSHCIFSIRKTLGSSWIFFHELCEKLLNHCNFFHIMICLLNISMQFENREF